MEALLVLQVIVVVFMIIVILMQQSSSDGFTGGGVSSGGMLSARGQANLLTKTTKYLAIVFLCNSIMLAYIATHTDRDDSIGDAVTEIEATEEQELINKIDAAEEKAKTEPATTSVPLTE